MVVEWSKNIFYLLRNIVIHSGCQKYEIFKKKITNTLNCESLKIYTRYLVNEKSIVSLYIYYELLSLFCENITGNVPSVLVVVFFKRRRSLWIYLMNSQKIASLRHVSSSGWFCQTFCRINGLWRFHVSEIRWKFVEVFLIVVLSGPPCW